MSKTRFFYKTLAGQKGPVNFDELRELIAKGRLKRADKLWADGAPQWVEAITIPGLFDGMPPDHLEVLNSGEFAESATQKASGNEQVSEGVKKYEVLAWLRANKRSLGLLAIFVAIVVLWIAIPAWKSTAEQRDLERQLAEGALKIQAQNRQNVLDHERDDGTRDGARLFEYEVRIRPVRSKESDIRELALYVWNNAQDGQLQGMCDGRVRYDLDGFWQSQEAQQVFVESFIQSYLHKLALSNKSRG